MELSIFVLGFVFSFIGSVPPGTINISIIQLGAGGNLKGALQFGVACALVELVYAYLAVKFQFFILSHDSIKIYLHLVSALAMLMLGAVNLTSAKNIAAKKESDRKNGFVKGLMVSLFNPLVIPFWVVATAYLVSKNLLTLSKEIHILYYILGISLGAWLLHIIIAFLGSRLSKFHFNKLVINRTVGVFFIFLGVYAILDLLKIV